MAASNLPLELVLRRSLAQGFVKEDDPELDQLRRSQISSNGLKDHNSSLATRVPMSPIQYQQRGLASSITRQSPALTRVNTINSPRARKTVAPLSGYGLDDFSSSDGDSDTDVSSESDTDTVVSRKSDAASYITHLTARLDPWEWKIRKVQEETKVFCWEKAHLPFAIRLPSNRNVLTMSVLTFSRRSHPESHRK